jgi:putative nucleotidyltransferase with HDIG domain
MPSVVQAVINSFEDANLEVNALAHKISQDEGLSTRVLRVANSSFYGLSRQISSIHDAVVVLGFNNIRSLAVAAGFVHAFPHDSKGLFDRKQFWRHSLRVASCARGLARCCRQNPETAFTAGLLSDVGQLVLDTCLHEPFNAVLERLGREGGDLYALEGEMLGFDHAEVGVEVAKRWNFPVPIQKVIQSHHRVGPETDEPLVCIVHLADRLAGKLAEEGSDEAVMAGLPVEVCAKFGLGPELIQACLPEIRQMSAGDALLLEE